MPLDDAGTVDIDAAQFSRLLRRAILLPICVILIAALVFLGLSFAFLEAMKKSDHSREVGLEAQECGKALFDLETGELDYLLEGDPVFLQTYEPSVSHVNGEFKKLKNLVATTPNLATLADQLIQSKDTWLEHAKASTDQRHRGKIPDQDWNKMGKTLRDNVRQRFDAFMTEETQIQTRHQHELRRMKLILAIDGACLVILLALTMGQLIRRNFSMLAGNYRQALKTVQQRHAALTRSEADLEQQKEWFRVTLTSIGDGVIVTDKEGRVVFMNHEAERLTGWSSVEALLNPLQNIFRIINEKTRAKIENPVSQVFRQNRVVGLTAQAVLVGRNGHEWPIEDTAAPMLGSTGEMLGVVLVFHDATDIRKAQHALRAHSHELEQKVSERTATLQQAVADLEAFSYTVSHDLRSPLRAMRGFADAVLEDYGDRLDDDGRSYLARIKNAGERLDRLIQDLLSFTRLSRKDTPLIDVDLDKLTRDIVENYPNLHAPAAEVQIDGTLPHVWGHEGAVTQVIANLLGNAAKFVKPGVTPKIRIWAENNGHRSRLWIEDNGIGINPGDVERIFGIFVRVNESQAYGGTGVGLAIVKKAVETMHGAVGVEPGVKEGTRFWVELGRVER